MSEGQIDITEKEAAKKTLNDVFRKSITELTPAESWFIQALLNDEIHHNNLNNNNNTSNNEDGDGNTVDAVDLNKKQVMYLTKVANKLSNETLFSQQPPVPVVEIPVQQQEQQQLPKARRPSNLGLWKAYEDGVHPHQLKRHGSRSINSSLHGGTGEATTTTNAPKVQEGGHTGMATPPNNPDKIRQSSINNDVDRIPVEDVDDDDDSEIQIIPVRELVDDGSSWDSQDDADHRRFDAWEVLRDEYSNEFGFDFTTPVPMNELYTVDNIPNSFQILGTSADDPSVQPHVMSPPMMDALMNFLPESVTGQNYWLRYSLVRDGASLRTLQRYVRATEYTILVIETRKGNVFGSFTTSPWHNQYGFFGSTPAFVWKMRHGRQTKCSSLFDQAQLESEIDVFMALDGSDNNVQLCHRDALGVGGDDTNTSSNDDDTKSVENFGFALYLNADLSRGTTSKCRTFHSPCLCKGDNHTTSDGNNDKKNESQIFDISGLEVWSLTPCFTVAEAEKLEMTKFFIEESIHNLALPRSSPNHHASDARSNSNISGDDVLDRGKFYLRVGYDTDSQARRDRWEYMNTMHTVGSTNSTNRGLGASPRYGYEKTS